MNLNKPFELECFQDVSKNKYIHPFYKTNRGHLMIAGDDQYKNDYILGYILRNIPRQYHHKDLKILMYSISIIENDYPSLTKYFKKPIINTRVQLLSLLLWVKKTMENRYTLFLETKAKDIYFFNQKATNKDINKRPLSHLLIIIHEIPKSDDMKNDPINNLIHEIVIKSRASGIHLIITSSNILNSISPVLKHHMDSIICKINNIEKGKTLISNVELANIKLNEVMVHECLTGKYTIYQLLDEPEKRTLLITTKQKKE